MQLADRIKPISYLKTNTADIAKELSETNEVIIITTNGQASFVCMDIRSYEEHKEATALLKILSMDDDEEGSDFLSGMARIKQGIINKSGVKG